MRRYTDAPPDQRLSDPIDGMSATKPIARPGDVGWASRCSAHPKQSLLHRLKCHACVPGDVELVTNLNFIQPQLRISLEIFAVEGDGRLSGSEGISDEAGENVDHGVHGRPVA